MYTMPNYQICNDDGGGDNCGGGDTMNAMNHHNPSDCGCDDGFLEEAHNDCRDGMMSRDHVLEIVHRDCDHLALKKNHHGDYLHVL